MDCGLIVDAYHFEHVHGEYRFGDGREERTGVPLTQSRHDRGLSTGIGRVTDGVRRRAQRVATVAEGLAKGCNPAGMAAACLYVAARTCGERLTQEALADAADVTADSGWNRELAEVIEW